MLKKFKHSAQTKRIVSITLLLLTIIVVIVILASMAADRSGGMYWTGFIHKPSPDDTIDRDGFFVADVSNMLDLLGHSNDMEEQEYETVPIGIGPVPSVKTLTPEEIKLYGMLSKGGGQISSEDAEALDDDIHWQEVVVEKGETLDSIARKYGLSVENIRKANGFSPKQKLIDSEVVYIPDTAADIWSTLAFVKKMEKEELDENNMAKLISVKSYTVNDGDSLWSIANKFDLDIDTLIGSNNNIKNINMLKKGMVLRIPNQDGVFIKIAKGYNLGKLADKYGSTKAAVFIANALNAKSKLTPGQEIFFPGGKNIVVADAEVKKKKGRIFVRSVVENISRRFGWPVMGSKGMSSRFGWRRSPFGRRRRFHTGLDIRASRGRPIVAANGGVVVHSGWMGGYGKTIVISHAGGLSTLYGHCSSLLIRRGVSVRRGQTIARVGSTGRSTGNHLHFEVRRGGSPINPIRFLR